MPDDSLNQRLEALRSAHPFACYQRARKGVLGLLEAGDTDASAYWQEELANLEYLLDASPLIIEKLRHHCFHVTGVRPYEYRSGDQPLRRQIDRRLAALTALGPDIRVPEAEALGGFGYTVDGGLFNLDTLKYFESLIAMRMGGVLDPLIAHRRPTIVEIGGGWGGMAFQLKTLVPQAQYVIVDLPELFLLSATYLGATFPDSSLTFYSGDGAWPDDDFVFVPYWAFPRMHPPSLDLALNTVSFQEMTTAQVEEYADGLARKGTQALYSLNRPRSVYNTELSSTHEILGRFFALHAVRPLPVPYNEISRDPHDKVELVARALGRRKNTYEHHIGRPRG